jgi:hypothetical protein
VSTVPQTSRDRPAETVAGFLAALAIFGGLIAIAERPVPIGVFSIFLGMLAAAMAERNQRLAGLAVAIAASGFLAGMIVSVITSRPLW